MSTAILGGGAFGAALAIALVKGGKDAVLWARDPAAVTVMREARTVPKLPGAPLPHALAITGDLAKACAAPTLLLAVPMQQLAGLLGAIAVPEGTHLVACCKGIDLELGRGPTALISEHHPHALPAILTGPSFAADIAIGLPTALTLACHDAAAGATLQSQLSTASLRIYQSDDPIGAELGGALKNVIAIACGVCIGAGLGDSARAALMTRGFAEMQRFARVYGAKPDTLMGLSGLGDLSLTCNSELSRNFRYGAALGRGDAFDSSVTVEGAATARIVAQLSRACRIDMPISTQVAHLVTGQHSVAQALEALLSRPLTKETRCSSP